MTGARLFAEMMQGYEVTHIFFVAIASMNASSPAGLARATIPA